MTPERWQQVKAVFQQALERDTGERTAFLAQACGDDDALRSEVTLLLDGHVNAGSFIETPADEVAAEFLAVQASPAGLVGQQLNQYRIQSRLGAGGMGEVFQARDTRLDRLVALKVLPLEVANDKERLQRFVREAKAASALNHPHVATIYEIGEAENIHFIAMEYIEGQTLAKKVNGSPLAINKVVEIGSQIADALDEAHSHGITHRDIKPANIMLTPRGQVKVLDFGLAKITRPESIESDISTLAKTHSGVVMGTPQYMSPEQVRGQVADHRSDIFSLGLILYEMLSGQRAFGGDSAAEVMSAILKNAPPPLSKLTAERSPALVKIVGRCLEKTPERRFQSASDLRFALEALSSPSVSLLESAPVIKNVSKWRLLGNVWVAWSAAVVLLLAAIALYAYFRHTPEDAKAVSFLVHPPEKATDFDFPIISPDGRHLAFAAKTEGKSMLWVRSLDSLDAKALPGTEEAFLPFWSPDSRQIGFFAHGKLKKVPLSGSPPITLCDAAPPIQGRGTWSRQGDILFGIKDGVRRVSAEGGVAEKVITGGAVDHVLIGGQLEFLPDGRHFLYWLATGYAANPEDTGVFLATLDGNESKRLTVADSGAVYAKSPSGESYLVFVREGTLLAQSFDTGDFHLKGEPVRLADQIIGGSVTSSENGTLVYRKNSTAPIQQQLGWVDRAGKPLGKVGSPGFIFNFALSPDEKRVVMSRRTPPQIINEDIWLVDLARGTETRFTSDPAIDHDPIWSPDGSLIVWNSNREKLADLYQKSSSGAGKDKLLLTTDNWKFACDWSSDGRFIIYGENDPKTSYDLWILPLEGKSESYPFLKTPFQDHQGHFSPDSKWVSYVSDKSGRMELYVQSFEPDSAILQVSTNGVIHPNASRWRRDGKELFYIDMDGKLIAVEIRSGATFVAGEPRALFDLNSLQAMPKTFDVTRDGQRFLLTTLKEVAKPPPFTVVLNWSALLPKPQ